VVDLKWQATQIHQYYPPLRHRIYRIATVNSLTFGIFKIIIIKCNNNNNNNNNNDDINKYTFFFKKPVNEKAEILKKPTESYIAPTVKKLQLK